MSCCFDQIKCIFDIILLKFFPKILFWFGFKSQKRSGPWNKYFKKINVAYIATYNKRFEHVILHKFIKFYKLKTYWRVFCLFSSFSPFFILVYLIFVYGYPYNGYSFGYSFHPPIQGYRCYRGTLVIGTLFTHGFMSTFINTLIVGSAFFEVPRHTCI